jgi:hypothetical protein
VSEAFERRQAVDCGKLPDRIHAGIEVKRR